MYKEDHTPPLHDWSLCVWAADFENFTVNRFDAKLASSDGPFSLAELWSGPSEGTLVYVHFHLNSGELRFNM